MIADTWRSAYVYIFGANSDDLVAADARDLLGKDIEQYRVEEQNAQIRDYKKMSVKVTPNLDGFEFNPAHQTIQFLEEWRRVDFRLRTSQQNRSRAANGMVAISVNGVVVADIPFSIYVGSRVSAQPGLESKRHDTTTAYPVYGSIFCSYSYLDALKAKRVEKVCQALGITYLRDKVSLRSGEEWNEVLLQMIDRADVFQLFWSQNAADSEFVKREWQHALNLRGESRRFIRPVYWTEPMAPPPKELEHLHFAFAPEL